MCLDSSVSLTWSCNSTYRLRYWNSHGASDYRHFHVTVATVLTVYGIETNRQIVILLTTLIICCNSTYRLRYWNSSRIVTVENQSLLGCNSTYRLRYWNSSNIFLNFISILLSVATVLTVYGIETHNRHQSFYWHQELQQYLPFTVLKLFEANVDAITVIHKLQQYLPFTVLKLFYRHIR